MPEFKQIENLENYLCPKILGNELLKKILALQLFTNPIIKGEKMHIMMVGSVATGKTMLGHWVSKILPMSSYVSCDVTKVGMREKLMFSDRGYAVLDEFHLLPKNTKDVLKEALELGQVSYSIHGEHVVAPARINAIAICNPKGFILNDSIPLQNQIPNTDPALLTRFGFIIPVRPLPADMYSEIALNYMKNFNDEERINQLKEYLFYVKQKYGVINIPEKLALEVGKYIEKLKDLSPMRDYITPRLINTMMTSLAAQTRMNLRSETRREDFNEIKKIFDKLYM